MKALHPGNSYKSTSDMTSSSVFETIPQNPLSCRSCSSKIRPVLYDALPTPLMSRKSRAYFEVINLLPKHVGLF